MHDGWILESSPFHAGEQEFQSRVGKREDMERFGRRVIRPFLPQQHRDFYAQLPFVVVGSVDAEGRPWASLLFGEPGFMHAPDPRSLRLDADPHPDDPAAAGLIEGAAIGLLGIELPTRRRNRVNGRITARTGTGLEIRVDQSFGNCPQYIQSRGHRMVPPQEHVRAPAQTGAGLTAADRALISAADTFFVSSFVPADEDTAITGVDVSHRGGRPGFVRVDGDTLTIPDFAGNNHFNTMGNFLLNPVAGLIFTDFSTGDMLHLTGRVEIIADGDDSLRHFDGALRAWRFVTEKRIRIPAASPLRFTLTSVSPNARLTGTWDEADARRDAERHREAWHDFTVIRTEEESDTIRSFYLEPPAGLSLPAHKAGQFLPIRVPAGADGAMEVRTYTLSSAPADPHYRISVKRETNGRVSNWLHDHLAAGGRLQAKAPRGGFFLDEESDRPVLLLAGGVGITPMIAMARHLAIEGFRLRKSRPVTLLHAVRDGRERAFGPALAEMADASEGLYRYIPVTSGTPDAADWPGHIDEDLLQRVLPLADYDVYICGPGGFMQAMYDILRALGINDARIHAEAFGPSSLSRRPDAGTGMAADDIAADALVQFEEAGFEQRWTPEDGSLLELAETHGLTPASGCRNGGCGSCAVKIKTGSVVYPTPPAASVSENEVLICCARPAKGSDTIALAL